MHAGSSTRYAGAPSRREPYVSANIDCKPTDKSKFASVLFVREDGIVPLGNEKNKKDKVSFNYLDK